MSELEEKLNQVLSNPQMMQQILSLANSLGQSAPPPEPEQRKEPAPEGPDMDLGMMKKVAAMAGSTGVDRNQQALLRALGPYVSRDRVRKLENAMRAAKMAAFASSLLQTRGGR